MLLDVVAFARDIGCDGLAGREADTSCLALARVGLLGARDADLDAHSLALGVLSACESGRDGVAGATGLAAALLGEVSLEV